MQWLFLPYPLPHEGSTAFFLPCVFVTFEDTVGILKSVLRSPSGNQLELITLLCLLGTNNMIVDSYPKEET
jgi:hypothetical protein